MAVTSNKIQTSSTAQVPKETKRRGRRSKIKIKRHQQRFLLEKFVPEPVTEEDLINEAIRIGEQALLARKKAKLSSLQETGESANIETAQAINNDGIMSIEKEAKPTEEGSSAKAVAKAASTSKKTTTATKRTTTKKTASTTSTATKRTTSSVRVSSTTLKKVPRKVSSKSKATEDTAAATLGSLLETPATPAEEKKTLVESKAPASAKAKEATAPAKAKEAPASAKAKEAPAPVEPKETPAPVEPKEAPAPVEPKEVPAPVEAEEASAPVEAEEASAPVEAEEASAPDQADEFPAPVEPKEVPAPVEAKEASAPDQADEFPAPDQADKFPAPDQADKFPAPDQADAFPALDQTGRFSDLEQASEISGSEFMVTGGCSSVIDSFFQKYQYGRSTDDTFCSFTRGTQQELSHIDSSNRQAEEDADPSYYRSQESDYRYPSYSSDEKPLLHVPNARIISVPKKPNINSISSASEDNDMSLRKPTERPFHRIITRKAAINRPSPVTMSPLEAARNAANIEATGEEPQSTPSTSGSSFRCLVGELQGSRKDIEEAMVEAPLIETKQEEIPLETTEKNSTPRILICWLGKVDVSAALRHDKINPGPVRMLMERVDPFDYAVLLTTQNQSILDTYRAWIAPCIHPRKLEVRRTAVRDLTDHSLICGAVMDVVEQTIRSFNLPPDGTGISFHLSPGTPATHAVLMLLATHRYTGITLMQTKLPGIGQQPEVINVQIPQQAIQKASTESSRIASVSLTMQVPHPLQTVQSSTGESYSPVESSLQRSEMSEMRRSEEAPYQATPRSMSSPYTAPSTASVSSPSFSTPAQTQATSSFGQAIQPNTAVILQKPATHQQNLPEDDIDALPERGMFNRTSTIRIPKKRFVSDSANFYQQREAQEEPAAVLKDETLSTATTDGTAIQGNLSDPPNISAALGEVYKRMSRIARMPISVLLLGESGTGKSRLSYYIHSNSGRSGKYCTIDCAGLTDEMLIAELFGQKGSEYPSIWKVREGSLRQANLGTIFFENIQCLTASQQVLLMKVISSSGDISLPLPAFGAHPACICRVRIIASASNDIIDLVRSGKFRTDLYYRMAGVTATLPSVRDYTRQEKDNLLRSFFLRLQTKMGKLWSFSGDAWQALTDDPWPGNLREISRMLQQICLLADDDETISRDAVLQHLHQGRVTLLPEVERDLLATPPSLGPEHSNFGSLLIGDKDEEEMDENYLPHDPTPPSDDFFVLGSGGSIDETLQEMRKQKIAEALKKADGNRTEAAKLLGISYSGLHYSLRQQKSNSDK